MKPNIRKILERAIEDGIAYGYHRAHKYTDTPDADLMQERIGYGIWLELDEHFTFDDEVECEDDEADDTDYECSACGRMASEHISATSICKIMYETRAREASLIVENKRLKALLEEKEEFIQRVITWPHDADPFCSMDHDNDTETYSCRN